MMESDYDKAQNNLKTLLEKRIKDNSSKNLQIEYNTALNKLESIETVLNCLEFEYSSNWFFDLISKTYNKCRYTNINDNESVQQEKQLIETFIKDIETSFKIYKQFDYLKQNIVCIGANGSGKTMLSYKLGNLLNSYGIKISAQKIMIIPEFDVIRSYEITSKNIENYRNMDVSLRGTTFSNNDHSAVYSVVNSIGEEFGAALDNLRSEKIEKSVKYYDSKDIDKEKENNRLDYVIGLWNKLIAHRELKLDSNLHLTVYDGTQDYKPCLLSDGEKEVLFTLSLVIQAPKNGFIIVDEPESHLHHTILSRLWDTLEKERSDCRFIYITHNPTFASSRRNAKIKWVKNYNHPDQWDIEDIPQDSELPRELLYELIGNRRPILFCEGDNQSLDYRIYSELFPDAIIRPVGSCKNVINYTSSFNKLPELIHNAYGIVDRDFRTYEDIQLLKEKDVYVLKVCEIENLFIDEEYLNEFAIKVNATKPIVEDIKSRFIKLVKSDLNRICLEILCNTTTNAVQYTRIHGKNIEEIKKSLELKFDLECEYDRIKSELSGYLDQQNYYGLITMYQNKGVIKIVKECLKVDDFIEKSLFYLKEDKMKQCILKNIPMELIKVLSTDNNTDH